MWFNANEEKIKPYETISMSNTLIISAIGSKSKLIRKQIFVNVEINKEVYECVFLIIPNLIHDCIIGINFLRENACIIDFCSGKFKINQKENDPVIVELGTIKTEEQEIICQIKRKINEITGIDARQRITLQEILIKNKEIFRDIPGKMDCYVHEFRVTDHTPYCQKGWPVPIAYQERVDKEIERMLQFKIIERCKSAYINPMVTVIKKNGNVRLCLDARKINHVTVPDFEGSPSVNEVLAKCSAMTIMSTIDLRSSFWQIPLKESCRDYTGFMYKGKVYRYQVTPFGLSTSLASLARGLDIALDEEVKQNTIIYVDDCLCFSQDVDTHLTHLNRLFQNLKRRNITVNLEKSKFFQKELGYLGFKLTTKGIQPTEEKITAILNFPKPRNPKQLKGFLGLTNYYNRFTQKYADTTKPLLDLLKKETKFKWTNIHDRTFEDVKNLFTKSVVLSYPIIGKRYFLQTDASHYAYGGVLYQLDENKEQAVIAFTSKTFKGAELRYFTTEKELLAIVRCLEKFRVYVMGQQLTIITDNKALTFMNRCHLHNSRITRWILYLQEYNFDIIHCSGKDNIVADILSRYPEDLNETQEGVSNNEYQINVLRWKLGRMTNESLRNIRKHQNDDLKFKEIIDSLLKNRKHKLHRYYRIINDKLYRKKVNEWKLYIPDAIINDIIIEIHELYGHPGINKTIKLVGEYMTYNKQNKRVKELVRSCDKCQKCKDNARPNSKGAMKPFIPKKKGEIVSMDIYGQLPTSIGGVNYIVVVVDNFTKFVKLYKVKKATTTTILNRLKQYIREYGKPEKIYTDNGTQFTSKRWKENLTELGIRPLFTPIRNPCSNLAERVNRQLGNLFRIFVGHKHKKWGNVVADIEQCINHTHHDTITMTPYEAQFGKPPKRVWEKYIDKEVIRTEGKNLDDIYIKIKDKRSKVIDKRNQELTNVVKFKEGEEVLLKSYHQSDALMGKIEKFYEIWEGPYIVTRIVGESTYEIMKNGAIRGIFNVRLLKPYFKRVK